MSNVINLNDRVKEKEMEQLYKEQLIKIFITHDVVNDWDTISED